MHQDAPTSPPAGCQDTLDGSAPAGSAAPAGVRRGQPAGPGRRAVMRLGAAAGLGVATVAGLAACGSDSGAAPAAPGAAGDAGAAGSGTSAGGSAEDGSSPADDSTPGGPLAKLADVPVGGSVAAAGPDGKPIVIAQPKAGEVVAFSARCTHMGCKVAPEGRKLTCPCHGATYDAFTGKNLSGPAPRPLAAVPVSVNGTDIVAS